MSKKRSQKKYQFEKGDKVRVVLGGQEIKRGVVYDVNDSFVQVLDPVEYKVKDADVCISDYHLENLEWFPINAPNASRRNRSGTLKGIKVVPFKKMDLSNRRVGIKLDFVSNER